MPTLNKIWNFLRAYKYPCIFVFFILLIGFIDDNSFLHRMEMQSQISDLKREIRTLRENNERDSLELRRLADNIEAVRAVARTRYFMQCAGEDIYVFVDSTKLTSPALRESAQPAPAAEPSKADSTDAR